MTATALRRSHLEEQMLELVAVELGGGLAVETQAPRLNFGVMRQVMAQHGRQPYFDTSAHSRARATSAEAGSPW